jgi:spore maturation protein CgeB
MRVLLCGEADRIGSGAWCYAETLREMGHEVTVFSETPYLKKYLKNKLLRCYRHFTRRLFERHRATIIGDLLASAASSRPQIAIILKGLFVSQRDIRALQQLNCWVVNINHDDFFSSNPNNWSVIQRDAIAAYDYLFPTREVNVEELRPYNSNVEFFPFAYFPRIHRPVRIPPEEKQQWDADIVFVGTWERRRCELLEYLVQQIPGKYAVYGSQWGEVRRTSPLRPFIKMKELGPEEMAKAIGGAKIALGFLRKENRDDYTQRTFEIPAIGGVLLAERTNYHLRLFKEGQEAEFFNADSVHDLCEKVSFLLTNETHREQIRVAGHKRVTNECHTYRDRLDRVFGLFNSVHRRTES